MSVVRTGLIALALLAAPAVFAAEKVTLGVFLPTTMVDGQARFQVSEALGKALEQGLGKPVTVKNFGRYEDFAQASRKQLDIVVVDAWAAAHLGPDDKPVAMATVGGDSSQRWAVVTRGKGAVVDLAKKRLAIPRGVKSLDAKFVTNVVFAGDLNADKHFKLVPVPNAESALRMVESNVAEAALVPADHAPKDARVIFRSAKLPGVVVLAFNGDAEQIAAAFEKVTNVGPFTGFTRPNAQELANLRALLMRGPPAKLPSIAESPVLRPDADAMVNLGEVGLVFPTFLDLVEAPTETPDD